MTLRNFLYLLTAGTMVVSCTPAPKEAFFNRGQPESLLDVSSEVINVKLASAASVQEVIDIINKEQPTRAQLVCQESDSVCREAKKVLHQFGVKTKYRSANANNVALVYERLQVRDCQNRYIDNTPDMNGLNAPTLGCSVAVNMVQMVTDKHEFTNPALMDATNAGKPLQAMTNYYNPVKPDVTPVSFPVMVEASQNSSSSR